MDQRRPPRKGGKSTAPSHNRPKAQSRPRGRKTGHPTPKPAGVGDDRLQKVLAHAGLGSRRGCEELITQGRVTVNGKVIRELGTKVDPARATIALDGQKIVLERMVYYAVYKPKGYVSTNADPAGRPRVIDILPEIPQRVYTVGRLDEMSVGLILLTNDGELAHKLAHPKYGVEKLYRVVVAGSPSREVLNQLTEGIWLAEGKVRAKKVKAVGTRGDSTILEMILSEGKNREVRRMLAKLGHKVMTLTRIAVGPISIRGLSAGQFRSLTPREVTMLKKVAAGEYISAFGPDRKAMIKSDRPRPDRPATGLAPTGTRRPGDVTRRPTGPPGRPGVRPAGPAGRVPSGRPGPGGRPSGPTSSRRRFDEGDQPPGRQSAGPVGRPAGPPPSQRPRAGQGASRPPEGSGPPPGRRLQGGEGRPDGRDRRPSMGGHGNGPRRSHGPVPRPGGGRRDEERAAPTTGDEVIIPIGRGRRVIGMEGIEPTPATPSPSRPQPRSRPAAKRPNARPKPGRRGPGPIPPRRRPGGSDE